jgi:DNA-directed RNA polymerase subunit RPC12/RpoP
MRRGDEIDSPEEVLFMLKCSRCKKNSAYWQDGTAWELRKTACPKCNTPMEETDIRKAKTVTTTYTCPACSYSYKDTFDFSSKKEEPDPEFEVDRAIFCLIDPKSLEEHRDAKRRLEGMVELGKELKEKEVNKHLYDALAKLKKLKIPELSPLLEPALKKAGYTEFSLDKPEMGREVTIGFNCLDSKSERGDYESRSALRKLVQQTLKDTNWRLMSEGIHYRLGYLNGRLRVYENEEDLLKLVEKSLKPKAKRTDV